jgi:VRR-NUC domain
MTSSWREDLEITIPYDPRQYDLYRAGDPTCIFHDSRWPLRAGRGRFGEFPLVVVRDYYRKKGYTVLASEPRLPNDEGFILLAYPGKRRARDPAYQRMEDIFGASTLAQLNARADRAKGRLKGGGDPDLFVFRPSNPKKGFFVEVKHRDRLSEKQRATFALIEELCSIKVARVVPELPQR